MCHEFETKKTVRALKQRVDHFTELENLNHINDVLLPQVKSFSDALVGFKDNNHDMQLAIRAFDESLSTKANKTHFEILRNEIYKTFMTTK